MSGKNSFGQWLHQRRRWMDLTQQALADQVGCARITVRRIEADALKPSKELAQILLEKLGIPKNEHAPWILFARGLGELPEKSALLSQDQERLTNVPIPLTSFIGRESDVARIKQRLSEHRLVTLIGAGGIGKTRLSQQLASQLLQNYDKGIWLVELASLSDPTLLPQTVAGVLGIQNTSNRPLIEILIHVLHTKTMVLIFDNCEHLLHACAQLADRLLKNCAGLRILATSREALGIVGEALYSVPALAIPEIANVESPDRLSEYESIRLFDERARLVNMDFALTMDNVPLIAQICARLDGIPLAIELAAAHMDILQVDEILKQLNHCLDLLVSNNRSISLKHKTMRASLDWSWGLLSEAEHNFMCQLSVFAGGWTLEAAQAVCDGDVLGLTSALVKKSLIAVDQGAGHETRYHLHEIVRQYARQKLVESGKEENMQSPHLKYFLQLSKQAETALRGPQQLKWYQHLNVERDNIRSALEHAAKTDTEAGLYLSGRLQNFWESFDLREGARWLTEFIERPESKVYPHARAKALLAQGWLLVWFHQFASAASVAHECLKLFRACKDKQGEVDALLLLGGAWGYEDDPSIVLEHKQQALALAQSLGDRWRQAKALSHLGSDHPDRQRRFVYWEEALGLFREVGDWRELIDLLGMVAFFRVLSGDIEIAQKYLDEETWLQSLMQKSGRGENAKTAKSLIALMHGDYEQARALLQEMATIADKLGNRFEYLWIRVRLGYVALREGDVTEARRLFAESAGDFQRDEDPGGVTFTLEGVAGLSVTAEQPELAARLIGWADATREQISDTRPPVEQKDVNKIIAACIANIGKIAFLKAYEDGRKMSLGKAVEYALKI